MPEFFNGVKVVTIKELIPLWYDEKVLGSLLKRYRSVSYGLNVIQKGGYQKPLLIEFDSLPQNVKDGLELDPNYIEPTRTQKR